MGADVPEPIPALLEPDGEALGDSDGEVVMGAGVMGAVVVSSPFLPQAASANKASATDVTARVL